MESASLSEPPNSSGERASIVYDGECPFCSNYVSLLRLRQSVGPVDLINAREDHPVVREVKERGYDLDNGMILKMGDRYFHGAECVHILSLLSTDVGLFNQFNRWIFGSPRRSAVLYPIMRAGRNLVLWLCGRKRISNSSPD